MRKTRIKARLLMKDRDQTRLEILAQAMGVAGVLEASRINQRFSHYRPAVISMTRKEAGDEGNNIGFEKGHGQGPPNIFLFLRR